jgi:dipeptidyl aminopeptidase/acylaminoacyl peptidase
MYSAGVVKRYGTWPSPISARVVATQGLRLGSVAVADDAIYWIEGRPNEGGCNRLVCRRPDGEIVEVTSSEFNVRTRVHEYGGGAYVVGDGQIFFSNFADQRIYRTGAIARARPHVTHAGPEEPAQSSAPGLAVAGGEGGQRPAYTVTAAGSWFYADATFDPRRRRLVCVREDHTIADREPITTLVSIPVDGPETSGHVLTSGHDFYSTPRLNADGTRLAWLAWRHPNMPWDGTELWAADVNDDGAIERAACVAGGASESIYQPGWSPSGELYFASDRDGWWKLYRVDETAAIRPVIRDAPPDAEFGRPQWIFGTATWTFAGTSRLVVSYTRAGRWFLATVDVAAGTLTPVADGFEPHDFLTATDTHAVLVGGWATRADAVVRVDLDGGTIETLRSSSTLTLDPDDISLPESIEFADEAGERTHAFYYAPRHATATAPPGERPPLIVISHGGPTIAATATLDLKVQYWTSRGFAVVDVNYGGSSGFGRPYRQRLNGQWGIVDVRDVVRAAQFLVLRGLADPRRLIVRGGSAGGYTTLAALTFHPDAFTAGASYYGISDIEVLARDTHKFESRYLDTLVGPYPAGRETYRQRSPIHYVDRLSCPLILFQGLEDKVVPPNQSEMMANAVRAKGLPVAYLAFEGEQHGFRKAETIVASLEAELFFYGAVFGFTPADVIEPVPIDNLSR